MDVNAPPSRRGAECPAPKTWVVPRASLAPEKAENVPAETWQTLPHPSDQGQYHQWKVIWVTRPSGRM